MQVVQQQSSEPEAARVGDGDDSPFVRFKPAMPPSESPNVRSPMMDESESYK